jgi:hypothetical protein
VATQQSQAIQNANQVISLAQQLLNLYISITAVNNAWNDDGSLTVIQNLATCALNADGSLGTADGTPNNQHPIDTRVVANAALQRAVSENTIASCLTQLNNIVSFINGNAVSATPGVRSLLNQVTGG